MRSGGIGILMLLSLSPVLAAQAPDWPLPGDGLLTQRDATPLLQPTASGRPESAFFGCVRNDGTRFHEALDLGPVLPRRRHVAVDPVTPVYPGRVAYINRVAGNSSYGKYVVLEHHQVEPALYTLYSHLASIPDDLREGLHIEKGTPLGILGNSAGGYSIPRSRAHLHLEIGLRLSDAFASWYEQKRYTSPNHHGNYNGMNLVGLDPLDFYAAFREGRAARVLDYFSQINAGVMLHVRTRRYPDFLDRYPQLKLPGAADTVRAGWEVILSGWGLPLSIRPLSRSELRGTENPGDICVVAVNHAELDRFACRRVIQTQGEIYQLDRGGRQIIELLFQPD